MISQLGLIALLLNDSGIVRGVSSQTVLNQSTMQFSQSSHRGSRLTDLHAQADYRIQHPCRDHRDQARAVIHVDNTPWAASFAISIPNFSPAKRMPRIVNL